MGRLCVLSKEVMLQEGTSKHRPGEKLPKRREQVKKSPGAGLISVEMRSLGTERRSAGWRKVLDTQEFVNGRLSTGKEMASFVFRLLWVNCLFPCAEYLSRNTRPLNLILVPFRKRD